MNLEFKYYELDKNEKAKLLLKIRDELIRVNGIIFAYVHGGFIESKYFRDIDIAIWIKNWNEAFNYTINLPVTLELKFNYPIDIQILNEAPLPFKYHVFTNGKTIIF